MRLIPKDWRDFQHYKDRNPPWIRLHKSLLDNKEFNALPPIACKVLVLLWLVASDTTDGAFDDDVEALAFRLRLPAKDVAQALKALLAAGFLLTIDGAAPEEEAGVPLSKQLAARNGFGSRHISDKTKRAVWERDGGKCCACASVLDIEYDHKHPVSKGGNSEIENVQLLCRPCNRKKRSQTAEQVATPAQPWLDIRTSETETETETLHPPSGSVLFEDFWKAWPKNDRKEAKGKCLDLWKAKGFEGKAAAIVAHVRAKATSQDWQKEGGQFVPSPIVYLRKEAWDGAELEAESAFAGGI